MSIERTFALGAILIGLLVISSLPNDSRAAEPAGFCDDNSLVKNYLAPIERLPQGSSLRPSGRIGVGPPYLRIYPPRTELVTNGYTMFEAHGAVARSGHDRRRLNWRVDSRLERVDKNGAPVARVKSKQEHVATVGDFSRSQFGIRLPVRPGVYRLVIEFRNTSGVLLRRLRQYYRAVDPSFELRLVTSFTKVAPGGAGYLRLENYGTLDAMYGLAYKIWNEAGQSIPVERTFDAIALRLEPGFSGGCMSFRAPASLSPGRYRIGVEATDPLADKDRYITETFEVPTP